MSSKPLFLILLAGALALLAGCSGSDVKAFKSVSEAMRVAETLEFLTIDPQVIVTTEAMDTAEGHQILGRATLNRERFGVILDGLEAMVAAGDQRIGTGCFNPGYALRESAPAGATILICLECSRVGYARDGKAGGATLNRSVVPDLEAYLAGLVTELALPTYLDR